MPLGDVTSISILSLFAREPVVWLQSMIDWPDRTVRPRTGPDRTDL